MKFGVFDQNDSTGLPLGEQYENRLRLTELYDRAGFHAYHLSEHHATPLNMSPSPSVFLAAVAQRTKRLRFGPLVYTLPLHHPLRLAEEICLLDHMSGGRLEVGVGRGISPFEVAYWGLDPKTAPVQYREALDVVLQALTRRELTFSGDFYRFKDVPIVMEPLQRPHPPLWCGVSTVESALWALGHKASIVINAPAGHARGVIDAYREGWRNAGHDPAQLPFAGISRAVVIADSDAEALAIARHGWGRYHDSFHLLWKKHGAAPTAAITPPTFDEVVAAGLGVAGAPSTVRRVLEAQAREAGANYLVARFAFGEITFEEAARSAQLFEREVMPALSGLEGGQDLMDGFVFSAVLVAAVLHAAWNTLAKGSADHFLSIMLVAIAGGVIALPFLPFLPLPRANAWPWLLASGVIHIGYFLFLARAYQWGDLAQVYPIARGTAPLLVALFGGGLLAERLSETAMAGLGLLVPGLWLMAVRGGRGLATLSARPVLAAFATAGFTAAYTIVDGIGVRASGHALSYSFWLFALFGVFMLPVTLYARGRGVVRQLLAQWKTGLGSGLMVVLAYSIALWAMTRAPVTLVAALRETSVLFAAIFAVLLLKEPLTPWRIVAMLLIAAGIVLLRLG